MHQADKLPIYELENKIISSLKKHNRLIIQAPTGSGKSTQVPQMLLDHGLLDDGQVVILQPRRLPTRMLASRVASERGTKLGQEVGYQIRFDDITSASTRIKFVTEGVLFRQMLKNPALDGVSALIFDEFHERHLYSDISLALALQLQETTRSNLKILVMSATLDASLLTSYLAPCDVLTSEGRAFPVQIEYLDKPLSERTPIWDVAAETLENLLRKNAEGDALIFMPGAYEISRAIQSIRNTCDTKNLIILPLHGELAAEDQDAAVARYDQRKVIVSTNVAETSLTIDGVRIVVDSGLARIPRYDPHRGINTLLVEKISLASADQRSGRAGRTSPGVCSRLWIQREPRAAQQLPEIQRLDLAEAILMLKAAGISDASTFRWLEPPDARSLQRAESLLRDLGAVDANGHITALGQKMLSFPVHPRYARMFLAAAEWQCVRPISLIAALTQERNLLLRTKDNKIADNRDDLFGNEEQSDFFVLMRAFRYAEKSNFDPHHCRPLGIHAQTARKVAQNYTQFLRIAESIGLPIEEKSSSSENIQKCILLGFSDHLASRCDAGTLRCHIVHQRIGVLARESVVQKAHLLVASEVQEIETKGGQQLNVLLSLATAISEEWLKEFFPDDFSEAENFIFDENTRRVVSRYERKFRDLVLGFKEKDAAPCEQTSALLADAVERGICPLKNWNDDVEQWIMRLNYLAQACRELKLPTIQKEDRRFLIQQICQNAISYKEIKDHPIWPVLKAWLSQEQQNLLEKFAPERYVLPNGRKTKIVYSENNSPTLSAKIQDLYDVKTQLVIGGGKIPLTIEILAPNFRPIQITQNLETFWRETYPKIKVELHRRYPKHKWL